MYPKKQIPFWIFTISVLSALVLPILLQDGMFMDGLIYAAVSKNLAEGRGSFWFPVFSQTLFPAFHEHPPGVFGIQSLFFLLLGKSIYVERFYSLLTFCITAWLISLNWKLLFNKGESAEYLSWLPCLLWGIIPLVFWSYSNNMLENTMGLFALSASFFILRSGRRRPLSNLFIGGVFIFAASLSKGFPGLFPLAIPIIQWVVHRKNSFIKSMCYSVFLIAVVASIYGLLLLNESARVSLTNYLHIQVIHGLQDAVTVKTRFFIFMRLCTELLVPLSLALLCGIYGKWKFGVALPQRDVMKQAQTFLFIGFSASLPLMVSMKQSGYYLVPAFPYCALAIGCMISPSVFEISKRILSTSFNYRLSLILSACVLASVLIFSFFQLGKRSRDQDKLQDVYTLGSFFSTHHIVLDAAPELKNDWALHGYLSRYFYISLHRENLHDHEYYLSVNYTAAPPGYEKVTLPLKQFILYKKSIFTGGSQKDNTHAPYLKTQLNS